MTVEGKRVRGSRGKKSKGSKDQDQQESHNKRSFQRQEYPVVESSGGFHGKDNAARSERERRAMDNAAIFGFIDAEVQQYFKGVEKTLDEQNFEAVEEMQLFLENVYTEVQGKELVLATDHSCSLVLEKLLRVSNDFQLRVFFDKFNGNFLKLFTHRFASHVCQTLITLCADAVEREVKSHDTQSKEEQKESQEENGVLLSAEELILNMCRQSQEEFTALISDPFASHIIRVILHVLAGRAVADDGTGKGNVRSKKSAKYNDANNNKLSAGPSRPTRLVPPSFKDMLSTITSTMMNGLSDSIVRSLAVHQVANPVLQLLLEVLAKEDETTKDELVDKLLMDITKEEAPGHKNHDRDAYVETLLRDPVGSHLLEKIVQVASPALFQKFYTSYFRGRLAKLSFHPVANYVIQQFFVNVKTGLQLEMMIAEVVPEFENLLKFGRPGVLRAVVEACKNVDACHKDVIKGLCNAFHTQTSAERKNFMHVVLHMETLEAYTERTSGQDEFAKPKFHPQGAVILQLILQYPEEHSKIVIDSYFAQKDELMFSWTLDPVGSHVIEAFLTSPTINLKVKRKILRSFLGKYHTMALDRFGGHTVDKCWAVSDIEMKEKIAQELLEHEHALSQSYYGKFILRNCKIDQFKRKKEEWVEREKGIERKKDMFRDILGDAILATTTGGATANGKNAQDADLPAPNPKMADLGFGGGIAGVKTKTEKKKKKSKKSSEDPDKMLIVDEGENQVKEKYKSDEIDKLFKKRSHGKGASAKKRNVDEDEDMSSASESEDDVKEEEEEEVEPKKKKKKVSKDLESVLDAIDATKKKKKSKKSKSEDEGDKKKTKKDKDSKKRKFMS
ncbi:armadillo-type protein [Mortierella sp. GBAus27b]|nr:Nucleolar protein 9 [Mortierella sp. GBA43]KAI8355516.1 armadillo-type protein [Mortierella sp. GBAus27b]